MKTNKKGISLIVLVITIIVMIILAATIILTLDGNNIIGKAQEAKTKNDTASIKEAASVFLAEYDLATKRGTLNPEEISANDYVMEKLEDMNIDTSDIYITEKK